MLNNAQPISTHIPLTLQVEKAFEHLTQYKDSLERDLRFHITSNGKLGVYLRQAEEVKTPSVHMITIDPLFLNDKQIGILVTIFI